MDLKYTLEDAKAYINRFDDIRFEGGGLFEECFTHQLYGSFNINRMMTDFAQEPLWIRKAHNFLVPITENIIDVNKQADISMDRVNAMPLSLLDEKPVVFLEIGDGHIMVDGQHRARKAILAGKEYLNAYIMPRAAGEKYKVRIMLRDRKTKQWEEIEPEMDLAMMMGKFDHHKMY